MNSVIYVRDESKKHTQVGLYKAAFQRVLNENRTSQHILVKPSDVKFNENLLKSF